MMMGCEAKYSLLSGKDYWYPPKGHKNTLLAIPTRDIQNYLPELNDMVENWRNERENILKASEERKLHKKKIERQRKLIQEKKAREKQDMGEYLSRFVAEKKQQLVKNIEIEKMRNQLLRECEDEMSDTRKHNMLPPLKKCQNKTTADKYYPIFDDFQPVSGKQLTKECQEMWKKVSYIPFKEKSGVLSPKPEKRNKKLYPQICEKEIKQNTKDNNEKVKQTKGIACKENQTEENVPSNISYEPECTISPQELKQIWEKSYKVIKEIFEDEIEKVSKIARHEWCMSYRKVLSFPCSIDILEEKYNEPLILAHEWCYFHKLSPHPFEEVTALSLISELKDMTATVDSRLSALTTIIHVITEVGTLMNGNENLELYCTAGQALYKQITEQSQTLNDVLWHLVKKDQGKLKLGCAIMLAFMGKSNQHEAIITTLISATEGISRTERAVASLALAYDGKFYSTVLEVIMEEWKSARCSHTLNKCLIGLRWLSSKRNNLARVIAEYLHNYRVQMRIHACLTLPFLKGGMQKKTYMDLIYAMNDDESSIVRIVAARTLYCMGQKTVVTQYIASSLGSFDGEIALEGMKMASMLESIDPKMIAALLPSLKSTAMPVKMFAMDVVQKMKIDNPQYVEAISLLTIDINPEVRATAFKTLGVMGASSIEIESLVLTAITTDDNEHVRRAAVELAGKLQLRGKRVQNILKGALKMESNRNEQEYIRNILQKINVEDEECSLPEKEKSSSNFQKGSKYRSKNEHCDRNKIVMHKIDRKMVHEELSEVDRVELMQETLQLMNDVQNIPRLELPCYEDLYPKPEDNSKGASLNKSPRWTKKSAFPDLWPLKSYKMLLHDQTTTLESLNVKESQPSKAFKGPKDPHSKEHGDKAKNL